MAESDPGGQQGGTPAPAGQGSPAASGSAGQGQDGNRQLTTEQRFERVETEQREQRGILGDIKGTLDRLAGGAQTGEQQAHHQAQQGTEGYLDKESVIKEAARRAVEAVNAGGAAGQQQAGQDRLNAKPPPEKAPREPEGMRRRLQRRVFGAVPDYGKPGGQS